MDGVGRNTQIKQRPWRQVDPGRSPAHFTTRFEAATRDQHSCLVADTRSSNPRVFLGSQHTSEIPKPPGNNHQARLSLAPHGNESTGSKQ